MMADLSLPYSFDNADEHKMQWYFGPNHYKTLKKSRPRNGGNHPARALDFQLGQQSSCYSRVSLVVKIH